MSFKNSAIAFLLLFAYSIGFAHDLVPHYHIEDNQFGTKHSELHQHVSPENHGANVVAHADHLDAGFYDYLSCLFSQVHHSSNDTQEVLHHSSDNSFDKFEKNHTVFAVNEDKIIRIPYQKSSKVHSKPMLSYSDETSVIRSRRGPPQFSWLMAFPLGNKTRILWIKHHGIRQFLQENTPSCLINLSSFP